ncbi:MAG: ATP-binding protein [Firmicutes bacterium]|nr:ATP-binding protein [Bacillota bacterium]
MSNNAEILYDAFNKYFTKGIEAKEQGNINLAKSQLIMAAETLKKLADISTGELKRTRSERVLKILQTVEALDAQVVSTGSGGGSAQRGGGSNTKQQDTTETMFTASTNPNMNFSKVAGLDDVKQAARDMIINPLKHSDLFSKHKLSSGGGILMYGLPGTGKTTIAKAIAGEVKGAFFNVKCSDIMSKWVGEAERNIRNLFEEARKHPLSIIFFDDFDSIGKKRSIDGDPTASKVLAELLVQMQGFEEHDSKILVIAATNLPWEIDTALMRPGRFNKRLYIPLPDEKGREFLIKRELEDIPLAKDISIADIVKQTNEYNGADVVELCNYVKRLSLNRDLEAREKGLEENSQVTQVDLLTALKNVKSSARNSDKIKLEQFMNDN